MPTTAGAPPGSGANFRALSAKLAARGARNPGALAAYIGRRKYGRKGFAKLSAHGRSHGHSNTPWTTLDFADGGLMRCPNCGYNADSAEFDTSGGASGTSVERQPEVLRTQARGNWASRAGFEAQSLGVGSQRVGLANGNGRALEFAGRSRNPIRTPADIVVTRSATGTAIIRHRIGGELVGEVGKGDDNAWRSVIDGQELSPHTHQRAALAELIGNWNRTSLDPSRPAMPLQAQPRQPELLSQLGISNVRAFASDPDDDGDDDDSPGGDTDNDGAGGLSGKALAVFRKLRARGMNPQAARKMALRAAAISARAAG